MKFGQHLLSHLTPEWRKQYVNYEALKKMLCDVRKASSTYVDEVTGFIMCEAHVEEQDKFFAVMKSELDKVEEFFKAQEADAHCKFRELKGKATAHREGLLQRHKFKSMFHLAGGGNVEMLKLAFGEFYLNLILLQNFQKLNYTAFRKILKKHDKMVTSVRGSEFFNNNVENNYFYTSNQVEKLITAVENTFAVSLEGGDKSKTMKKLRVPPLGGERSHWVTLRTGLFNGMILVSIIVLLIAVILHPLHEWPRYSWVPLFRAFRAGLLVVLALYGFATNTYVWRTTGVNSTLIFEFNPRNYRSFTQLFEIASLIGVIWIICAYLFVFAHWLNIPHEIGPSVLLLIFPIILCLPLPVFYWHSRVWFLRILGRVVLAPFFYVYFADFWLADQLNSLAIVLLDVEFFGCWITWGKKRSDPKHAVLQCDSVDYCIRPFLAILPAWFRFAQCVRRYYNTSKAFPHLVNAGKYSTSFFVVAFSSVAASLKDKDGDHPTGYYVAFGLWIMSAFISTCYTFIWDIKMDWGLFEGRYFLREDLIYSNKIYYALAICEDLIFRCLWTLTISVGEIDILPHKEILTTVLAIMEVFRRFVWNFFRLEAEHLNNVGEFRAVRDISLHPIKLAPEHEAKDKDAMHSFPSGPLGGSLQHMRRCSPSSSDSDRGSIISLDVYQSINTLTSMNNRYNRYSVVVEDSPDRAADKHETMATEEQHATRAEAKDSSESHTEAADESELLTANNLTTEADYQVIESSI